MSKWDERFLELAKNISQWSKDPSTKVGCVIIGPNKEILTTGYNGLPRGTNDDIPDRLVRPEKYFWFEHAERNAIYNAARIGVPLLGATAYVTLCPCMDCARGIVQSGIKRVVTVDIRETDTIQRWKEDFMRTEILFEECGVTLDYV